MKTKIILLGLLIIGFVSAETNYFSDFRYRYEIENQTEKDNSRDRQRIRVRMGVKYQIEDLEVGIRIASGGNSIQSPHQTLGDNGTDDNASFGLDQAYLKCNFGSSTLTLGKSGINLWQQNEILIDGDYSPEGISYSYTRFGVTLNSGYYLLTEKNWDYGIGQDENLLTSQLIYGLDLGNISSKTSITNATMTTEVSSIVDSLEISNLEPTISSNSISTQFKMGNHTIGLDYHITDASNENTALVAMFRTKILDHSFGLWYYDVSEKGILSHDYTQDNFPITSAGFSGLRFQVGFKLCKSINTDVRYYMQTMDANNNKINRVQLNLNVSL